jgi:uncharacterized membrane protein
MAAPFSGFVVPPVLHSVFLGVGTLVVAALLYVTRPPVTQRTVLAFVPWIVSGAALHVFYQLDQPLAEPALYPGWAEPLFSAPAVYLTTFLGMGAIWLVATLVGETRTESDKPSQYLLAIGTGVAVSLTGLVVFQGLGGSLAPVVPILALIGTGVLTFLTYVGIGAWRTAVMAKARLVGAVVLFAHLLDGVTTAVGVDLLGTGERSLIPARIIEFAGGLPTAEFIGSGWLFVVVKFLVAAGIVVAFADFVEEQPTQGNLLFALVAAVGLGPAMNNLFLFLLGVP